MEENAHVADTEQAPGSKQTVPGLPASQVAAPSGPCYLEGVYLKHLQISCHYCNLGPPCVLKLVPPTVFCFFLRYKHVQNSG